MIQHADDDGNIPVSANHHAIHKTKTETKKEQVLAVANLAHPITSIIPSFILMQPCQKSYALQIHDGLQNELKNRGFSSVVSSGSSPEGIRKIQQHEYPLW